MAKEIIKFGKVSPPDFQTVVDERVKNYFNENEIDPHGNNALYIKAALLFGAFICAYACILSSSLLESYGNTIVFIWAMLWYVLLGKIIPGLGFNVMHDAVHGSFSKNKQVNAILAFWSGDAMGGSTFAWKLKHNILHHSYTNVDGHDDDIVQYPMFRLSPHQGWLPHHKYQHRFAKILYCFLSIQWSLVNDYKKVVFRGKVLERDLKAEPWDYVRFGLGKIVHMAIFVLPAFVLPHWWYALAGFVLTQAISGYTLSIVFQMAHVVEGPDFLANPENGKINMPFKEHQVHTTANFEKDNPWLTWYVGGLNYQIEHHLFPNVSHVHYPAISAIVEKTAQEYGVPYYVFPTFKSAKESHFAYLKLLGEKPATLNAAAA